MTSDRDMQSTFINWVREKAGKKNSFVDELADLLNVSKDSAYRRLRGETLLTFNEISKISSHYKVSLDSFLNLATNAAVFTNRKIDEKFTFKNYLISIRENLTFVNAAERKKMMWAAKDVPILHYFQSPGLTRFKAFFWQRTILNVSYNDTNQYDPDSIDPEIISIAKEIWDLYCKIPSVEIWSDETLHITLRQIEYYYECNIIARDTAIDLAGEFIRLIKHIRNEVKIGRKFPLGGEDYPGNGSFHLYYNEIAIGDNTIYFQVNDRQMVFLTYNMLNILSTTDDAFCHETEHYLENILQKSVPLSVSSEKERNKFFNIMEGKVEEVLKRISAS